MTRLTVFFFQRLTQALVLQHQTNNCCGLRAYRQGQRKRLSFPYIQIKDFKQENQRTLYFDMEVTFLIKTNLASLFTCLLLSREPWVIGAPTWRRDRRRNRFHDLEVGTASCRERFVIRSGSATESRLGESDM